MHVLLTGASGFIGRRLTAALLARGHRLRLALRTPDGVPHSPSVDTVAADFVRDHDAAAWAPRLVGIDAVVNLVGIFRETPPQTFHAVHVRAPVALFDACVGAGVPRVIQLSALGADEQASSRYHQSKKQADDHLLRLPLAATVLQPSLVFGIDGASSRAFLRMAAAPCLALPRGGVQCVQPLHVDDLVDALVHLLEQPLHDHRLPRRLHAVGPQAITLREYLGRLRRALGLGALPVLAVPMPLARLAAVLAERSGSRLLDRDALAMLERGNCADPAPFTAVLGHPPRDSRSFVAGDAATQLRDRLVVQPALFVLRASLSLVWIGTGIVSLAVHPIEDSLALLARSGVPAPLAPTALYSAALLDIVLGLSLWLPARWRRLGYAAQAVLMLGYMAIITLELPEFWAHPYAPMLKNLPMLAALWLLERIEDRRWIT